MPDEHESAFAAWLDSPETKREVEVIRGRMPGLDVYEAIMLALQMEILVSLDLYGDKDTDITIQIDPDLGKSGGRSPDEDPPEPWQDPDNTGWKP